MCVSGSCSFSQFLPFCRKQRCEYIHIVSVCTVKTLHVCAVKTPVSYVTQAFWRHSRERFDSTHGSVLNVHTGAISMYRSLSLSLSLSDLSLSSIFIFISLLLSLFAALFSQLSLLILFSLILLSCLSLFRISMKMTMITRTVGSLYSQLSWHGPWPLPCLTKCSHHAHRVCLCVSCASLVPLAVKWACTCTGDGDMRVLVLVLCCGVPGSFSMRVAGRVSCRVVSCLLCCCLCVVVCWIVIVVLLVVPVEWWKKKQDLTSMTVPTKNDICNRTQITPQGVYLHYGLI